MRTFFQYRHRLHIFPLLSTLLLLIFASCRDNTRGDYSQPVEIEEISKSLYRGDISAADSITEALRLKALSDGDSILWAEAMVQFGVNAFYSGQPDKILAYTDSASTYLRQLPRTQRVNMILSKLCQTRGSYFDQYNFNTDSLSFYLRRAVDFLEAADSRKDLPQVYGNYANAMRMTSRLDSAAIYYHRAVLLSDSLNLDQKLRIDLYNGLAGVFSDMRDFDNSRKWWEKSLRYLDSMGPLEKFNTLSGYGNFQYYLEDYKGANETILKLKGILDSIPGARWHRMFNDVNLADTWLRLGQPEKARALLDSTAPYFHNEQPNPVATSYINSLKIREAVRAGNLFRAATIADAHPATEKLRLEQRLARLEVLDEFFYAAGRYKEAYDAHKRYDHLRDSLRSTNLRQQLSALTADYERDARILHLAADNTSKQAHIYLLLAVIGLVLTLAVGLALFLFWYRQREQRHERKMMDKIVSLRQENLRNRITPHFIYNALNQELVAADKGEPSHLDALVRLIRRQQYAASEILVPFSDELSFVDDYINVARYNLRGPLSYTFTSSPQVPADFMFPSMTLQILVENAFKHGFSSLPEGVERILRIAVDIADGDSISVSVFNNRDTGHSFSESTGTGLRVLVETIRLVNERTRGNIEFRSFKNVEEDGVKGWKAVINLPPRIDAIS